MKKLVYYINNNFGKLYLNLDNDNFIKGNVYNYILTQNDKDYIRNYIQNNDKIIDSDNYDNNFNDEYKLDEFD